MRYHYEKPTNYRAVYGDIYVCNHQVYSKCTLYLIGNKGLGVIQQRHSSKHKATWWTDIDPWLIDDLYLNHNFKSFFDERAGECEDGLYPTVTVRQIMWALKMKPLKKEKWETCFDRRFI